MPFWWITIIDEGDMAQMHNPPHPGEVLKDTVLRAVSAEQAPLSG